MFQESFAVVARLWRDLGEPDGCFHSFNLAEEGTNAVKFVAAPVLQQTRGFRCYLPIAGVGDFAPFVDLIAKVVDEAGLSVLLLFGGEVVAFIEDDFFLRDFPLAGLRDGRYEFRFASAMYELAGGLTVGIELPVLDGVLVWRVKDGSGEELGAQLGDAPK